LLRQRIKGVRRANYLLTNGMNSSRRPW